MERVVDAGEKPRQAAEMVVRVHGVLEPCQHILHMVADATQTTC
jgi:hypothetical protein